jgi:hypothetical protein
MKTTVKMYKKAYEAGIQDEKNGWYRGYHTAIFNAVYDCGRKGTKIDFTKIVKAVRYGDVPEGGRSHNYRDDYLENGTSVAYIEDGKEIGSSIWFKDRSKVSLRGILLPQKGSDGESLLLPLNLDQYDF